MRLLALLIVLAVVVLMIMAARAVMRRREQRASWWLTESVHGDALALYACRNRERTLLAEVPFSQPDFEYAIEEARAEAQGTVAALNSGRLGR